MLQVSAAPYKKEVTWIEQKNNDCRFILAGRGRVDPPASGSGSGLDRFQRKIATVDDAMTMVEAMAIREDTIIAVGRTRTCLNWRGPDTKRLDVNGRDGSPRLLATPSASHGVMRRIFPK